MLQCCSLSGNTQTHRFFIDLLTVLPLIHLAIIFLLHLFFGYVVQSDLYSMADLLALYNFPFSLACVRLPESVFDHSSKNQIDFWFLFHA